jgi:putative transposase
VARYLPRFRKPPSQGWRTFLTNHLAQTAAIDFFTVPTATFRVPFVFVVLAHERRRVVHFGVTEHPTQEWTMQQLREAFPWDAAPRYVLRDRDAIYGRDFAAMTRNMGMEEVLTAPRSPWQNPFAERLVGSIRRECLDHVIVWNERSLRRTLQNYFAYYQRSRTHLALGKDAPAPRTVEPPEQGRVVAIPQVGGLHHRYQRRAAYPEQAVPPTYAFLEQKLPLFLDLAERTLVDSKSDSSRHGLPALGSTRRRCGRSAPHHPNPTQLLAPSAVHRRDLQSANQRATIHAG